MWTIPESTADQTEIPHIHRLVGGSGTVGPCEGCGRDGYPFGYLEHCVTCDRYLCDRCIERDCAERIGIYEPVV